MKIAVVGLGYVGASIAACLSPKHEVIGFDIDKEKADKVNRGDFSFLGPTQDELIKKEGLSFLCAPSLDDAIKGSDFIIVAVPTDYHESLSRLDTSIVEEVVGSCVRANSNATIVIKSTVPIGFCDSLQDVYKEATILFSPEFLRETTSIEDTFFPSRIIVGSRKENKAKSLQFLDILSDICRNFEAKKMTMSLIEAESVKLFTNTYLALRVAYFNELDSFAYSKGMDAKKVIGGVCADTRIGDNYNNPSFGYGGYCLPKDSKQLFSSYEGVPEEIVKATIASNSIRVSFIVDAVKRKVEAKEDPVIGIYRLNQKKGSNSLRNSTSARVLESLSEEGYSVLVYEPLLTMGEYLGAKVDNDLPSFLSSCDLIVANRYEKELEPAKAKVFTRDLFGEN
ncbi:MAG: nucleotide sugar dehydrogenase [Bacilli bacterium]|nr:nucleotide sugar dehydrogenase [Bacilli bacterium]